MNKYLRVYDTKPGHDFRLVEEAEIESLTPEQFEELLLKYVNKAFLRIYICFELDPPIGTMPERTPYRSRNFDISFHEIADRVLGEGESGKVLHRIKLARTKAGLEKIMADYI